MVIIQITMELNVIFELKTISDAPALDFPNGKEAIVGIVAPIRPSDS